MSGKRWFKKYERFHVRFSPTSAPWLNMVERFFRGITHNRFGRGVFQYLEQLIIAIEDYIDGLNKSPKHYIWTAKANDILKKITRTKAVLIKRQSA